MLLRRVTCTLVALAALAPTAAWAHDPPPAEEKAAEKRREEEKKKAEKAEEEAKKTIEVTVRADPPDGDAASRAVFGRRELELRPRLRPGDIVEAVPGVFAVQHAGGGKANQYFLRGFDADHGTDVALSVDGVPVNMVSHGHGQGYADLHFLIPELVVGLEGYKGPSFASFGDFATGGAIQMRLAETLDESVAQVSVGQYGILRGLVIVSPKLREDFRVVAAAEVFKDDGPFLNPEDLHRFNVFAKVTHDLTPSTKASFSWMSYGSEWNASGQIPARAVCGEGEAGTPGPDEYNAPCIDRFGFVDKTEGGATQRHVGQLALTSAWDDTQVQANLFLMRYRFSLYSNFTFFAEDPVNGDQIEQGDDRWVGGFNVRAQRHTHYRGAQFTTSGGAQVRVDGIDNALYNDKARERLSPRVDANISQASIGVWAQEDIRLNRWIRILLGGRADRFDVNVVDRLEDQGSVGSKTSGVAGATLFSPKAMAIISPIPQLDIFLNYGRGFHSNDARAAVRDGGRTSLLTPATGYEVGVRVKPVKDLQLDAALFLMDIDSELVWVGDAGTTEASGATRRFGVELSGRYRISNWLFADAEATFVEPKYRANAGNGDAIALAPTQTFVAGIGARPTFGDFTPFASVRLKSIGDRPAVEDGSLIAQGFTIVDANAGLRWKSVEVGVDIQNLFDAKWREVNFATETRLPYEPAPVTGIHYSPGWPFTAIGRVSYAFR